MLLCWFTMTTGLNNTCDVCDFFCTTWYIYHFDAVLLLWSSLFVVCFTCYFINFVNCLVTCFVADALAPVFQIYSIRGDICYRCQVLLNQICVKKQTYWFLCEGWKLKYNSVIFNCSLLAPLIVVHVVVNFPYLYPEPVEWPPVPPPGGGVTYAQAVSYTHLTLPTKRIV